MSRSRELPRRCGGDRGASLAEYAMLLAMIAIICIGAITALGLGTTDIFDRAGDAFRRSPTSTDGCCGSGGEAPGVSTPAPPTSTTTPGCPTSEPSTLPGCPTTTTTPP